MSVRKILPRIGGLVLLLPLAAHAQISGTPKASSTTPGIATLGAAGGSAPYSGFGLVPYSATGGSTSRDLADRSAETLSARDLGVSCGVNRLSGLTGTDDTAALTSALSSLAATYATGSGSGVPQLIIHGACLTGPLTITRPIHIVGDGQSSSSLVLKSGSTAPLLTVAVAYDGTNYYTSGNPPADVTISGLEMTSQSNADAPGQGVAHGLALRTATTNPIYTSVHLDHVKIHNLPGNGIDGAGFGANGFLDADHIYLKANAGFNMNITADYDWRLDHMDVNGAGMDNILMSGSAGIVIDHSTIYSAGHNNVNYYQAAGSTAHGQNIIAHSALDGAQWNGLITNHQGGFVTLALDNDAINNNSIAGQGLYGDLTIAGDATKTIVTRPSFDKTYTMNGTGETYKSAWNIWFQSTSTGSMIVTAPAILGTNAQAYSDPTRLLTGVPAATATAAGVCTLGTAGGCAAQNVTQPQHAPVPVGHIFGDSRAYQQSISVNVGNATQAYGSKSWSSVSPVMWANRLLGQALSINLDEGYTGTNGGLLKVNIVNGGTVTGTVGANCTSSAGTGVVLGAPVITNGTITAIPVTTPGSGLQSTTTTITCPGVTGSSIIGVVGGSGQFGNSGETSCQAANRLPDLQAVYHPGEIVFVDIGINDPANSLTLAQSETCMATVFNTLLGDGEYVIYHMDGPHTSTGGLTGAALLAAQQQDMGLRTWVRGYARAQIAKNPSQYPHFYAVDTSIEATVPSTGAPQTNWTTDGLHRSPPWAYVTGVKDAAILRSLLGVPPGNTGDPSALNVYNATINPGGMMNTNPTLSGTSGTISGSVTGTVASNYQVSSTLTGTGGSVVASVETTRTDGLPGSRQVITLACPTSGGSATQSVTFRQLAYTQLATAGFANGDVLSTEAYVEVSNPQFLTFLNYGWTALDTASAVQSTGTEGSTSGTYAMPSAAVGQVPPLSASTPILLRTPPFTLTNVGTGAGTQVQINPGMTFGADCTQAGAGVTIKISNPVIRKVV